MREVGKVFGRRLRRNLPYSLRERSLLRVSAFGNGQA